MFNKDFQKVRNLNTFTIHVWCKVSNSFAFFFSHWNSISWRIIRVFYRNHERKTPFHFLTWATPCIIVLELVNVFRNLNNFFLFLIEKNSRVNHFSLKLNFKWFYACIATTIVTYNPHTAFLTDVVLVTVKYNICDRWRSTESHNCSNFRHDSALEIV